MIKEKRNDVIKVKGAGDKAASKRRNVADTPQVVDRKKRKIDESLKSAVDHLKMPIQTSKKKLSLEDNQAKESDKIVSVSQECGQKLSKKQKKDLKKNSDDSKPIVPGNNAAPIVEKSIDAAQDGVAKLSKKQRKEMKKKAGDCQKVEEVSKTVAVVEKSIDAPQGGEAKLSKKQMKKLNAKAVATPMVIAEAVADEPREVNKEVSMKKHKKGKKAAGDERVVVASSAVPVVAVEEKMEVASQQASKKKHKKDKKKNKVEAMEVD